MTKLYLLRHGIALPHGTPDIPDDERPLTPKGERRVSEIGRALRRLGVAPDLIVTSPLPRAAKTAELVAEELKVEAEIERNDALLASRDAASIRAWLQSRPETNLMLVGHNPAFSDLIGLLASNGKTPLNCELRKGGVAAFHSSSGAEMILDWLARPKLLRCFSEAQS